MSRKKGLNAEVFIVEDIITNIVLVARSGKLASRGVDMNAIAFICCQSLLQLGFTSFYPTYNLSGAVRKPHHRC